MILRSFSATKLQKHELSTTKICKKLRFSSLSRANFPGVSEYDLFSIAFLMNDLTNDLTNK